MTTPLSLLLIACAGPLPLSRLEQVHGYWEGEVVDSVDGAAAPAAMAFVLDQQDDDPDQALWAWDYDDADLADAITDCTASIPRPAQLVLQSCTRTTLLDGEEQVEAVSQTTFTDVWTEGATLFLGPYLLERTDLLLLTD